MENSILFYLFSETFLYSLYPNIPFHTFNSIKSSGTKVHVESRLNAWNSSVSMGRFRRVVVSLSVSKGIVHRVFLSLRHLWFKKHNLHIMTASSIKTGCHILIYKRSLKNNLVRFELYFCACKPRILLSIKFLFISRLQSHVNVLRAISNKIKRICKFASRFCKVL